MKDFKVCPFILFCSIYLYGRACAHDDVDLVFPDPPSPSNFVKLNIHQAFSDISICLWFKNSFGRGSDIQGLLSYNNRFQSYKLALTGKGLWVNIVPFIGVGGLDFPKVKTNTSVRDGAWHEACTVWNHEGWLHMFIDGVEDTMGIFNAWASSQVIADDGCLVIGQLSVQTTCKNVAGFQGTISHLNIWSRCLTRGEVHRMHAECSDKNILGVRLLTWTRDSIMLGINGSVDIIRSSLERCSRTGAYSYFQQHPGIRLRGKVVQRTEAKHVLTCAHECLKSHACLSFNLLKLFPDKLVCELLMDSKESRPNMLELTHTSDHYATTFG